jgi:hypothetical protein
MKIETVNTTLFSTTLFNTFIGLFENVNSSKFAIGIAMIMFNIGSKYLVIDMSKTQEQFFKNVIIRRVTIFCIFFVATRDVIVSLVLTSVFVILALGLFNERSKFYVLPNINFYDNVYTLEEYEQSKIIINGYEKMNKHLDFCKNN